MVELRANKKKYKWALWGGLICFVCGIGLSFVGEPWFGLPDSERPFNIVNPWQDFLFGCVLIPIVEELGFRLWGVRKKCAYVVSVAVASFLFGVQVEWWMSIVAMAFLVGCILIPRKEEVRIPLMIVVTSLLFALLHIPEYDVVHWSIVFYLIDFFGSGLMACYFAINYGLWLPILIHVVYDCVLTWICMDYYMVSHHYETEDYVVDVSTWTWNAEHQKTFLPYRKSGDTVEWCHTLQETAKLMVESQINADSVFICQSPECYRLKEYDDNRNYYLVRVVSKRPLHYIDYRQVVWGMGQCGLITLDTTYETMNLLYLKDSVLSKGEGQETCDVNVLCRRLRDRFRIPLMVERSLNPLSTLSLDIEVLDSMASINECVGYMEKNYGLSIKEVPNAKMQVVEIGSGTF